jgi:hypothetical protein
MQLTKRQIEVLESINHEGCFMFQINRYQFYVCARNKPRRGKIWEEKKDGAIFYCFKITINTFAALYHSELITEKGKHKITKKGKQYLSSK